ncbi:MAG: alpha-galactosidase [Candidatus Poribacteria bacterium]
MEQQLFLKERETVGSWMETHFAAGALPPFSFTYDGKSSAEFLRGWDFRQETERRDETKTEHLFTYTDPQTGLQAICSCEVFADFPAVEWVVRFKNNGADDTPIIENIQALDATWNRKEDGEFVLHRALGSSATSMDFAPIDESMAPNSEIRFAPVGGRSSSVSAFPFFNIDAKGEGVIVGIGWSGQWSASLVRDEYTGLTVRAGMELTHLKLHPGEEIRTPRILLLFWQNGNRIRGHNLLRRFILTHHTLQKDGAPVTTPIACSGSKIYDIANKATEQNQIALAKRYIELGVAPEYLWLDAGWFEGGWPNGVGNWFPKKEAFPNGLKAVSDAIKKMGMGLLIWFEPERVHTDTWLDREHPDWILKRPDNANGLLDLGNPEARRWLTDHISKMIESEGISVYRHDFNIEPLPFWRAADEPDRQGIAEIRYIEGLYAFWDELLARQPGLIIDNCASGGRRIDLETTSRSIPLWRTDDLSSFSIEPTNQQAHNYGLHLYLPCNSVANSYPDQYIFRSSMSSGVILRWNPYEPDFPVEQAKRLMDEFKRLRLFFYGDFYPLTSHSVRSDVWMAYQFHRADLKQGMVLAFRRPKSPYLKAHLRLGGLSPNASYELHFEDTNTKRIFSGEELAAGLDVIIEDAPGSLLITYRQDSG